MSWTRRKSGRSTNRKLSRPPVMALIGPSGAGKSTVIRCVNRLVEPTSGSIELNGVDIVKLGS
ncbi:MAG: ATP-binding cassette domain-containing protein, partial [Pseudolabrys sp.]